MSLYPSREGSARRLLAAFLAQLMLVVSVLAGTAVAAMPHGGSAMPSQAMGHEHHSPRPHDDSAAAHHAAAGIALTAHHGHDTPPGDSGADCCCDASCVGACWVTGSALFGAAPPLVAHLDASRPLMLERPGRLPPPPERIERPPRFL